MPRFFMHLVDHLDVLLDPEGLELPAAAIAATALFQARDCMAGDVLAGRLDLRYSIDVQDESGATVHRLSFLDALTISYP